MTFAGQRDSIAGAVQRTTRSAPGGDPVDLDRQSY
jgi:hypothetical protein